MSSPSRQNILELGKALVHELDLEDSVDTLGRWMAHYIAELIHEAENAPPAEVVKRREKASAAILQLWQKRHELPDGKRPFEKFEPILRALESFDPDEKTPRYYRNVLREVDEKKESSETKKWLRAADGLDYSARLLIKLCFVNAANGAANKAQKWIALAEAAKADDGPDIVVIRKIITGQVTEPPDPSDELRKELEDRLTRLDAFQKGAAALAEDLRQRLATLEPMDAKRNAESAKHLDRARPKPQKQKPAKRRHRSAK